MSDELDNKILFMDNKAEVVIGFTGFCDESNRVFDIPLNDLASNVELLDTLNLISMYASGKLRGEDYAISFFINYLGSFYHENGVTEKLSDNPTIRILVQDKEKLDKVSKIFGRTK